MPSQVTAISFLLISEPGAIFAASRLTLLPQTESTIPRGPRQHRCKTVAGPRDRDPRGGAPWIAKAGNVCDASHVIARESAVEVVSVCPPSAVLVT